jgi:hypothetical protein
VVDEFWSEITQDKDDQDEEWLYVQEGKGSNLNEKFFCCSFLLAAEGATRDGAFLLSEAELVRVGSNMAYLDISWARVRD